MIKKEKKKRKDLLLGAVLLLLAGGLWLGRQVFQKEGSAVRIMVKDQEFGRYSLEEDREIPIGEGNILCISEGKAYMKWADCPDQLCVHQGKISHQGETIACLPNRVTVRVIGGAVSGVDSISG